MDNLSLDQITKLKRLEEDFPYRCKATLEIKNKAGQIVPYILNDVQEYVHKLAEDQKRRTGRVRLVVLKGRKQGVSTYVAARFFDRMMREDGIESFILAHREDTVGTLYDIVSLFHEKYPDVKMEGQNGTIICKQKIIQENAKKFTFENKAGYTVGTAGKGEIGRGFTIQQLHLSEAAFYEAGDKISASIMKAVADAEGTEIIMESTANGIGNLFHNTVIKARQGLGSFELAFIPWYWQKEYRRTLPTNFKLTEEEELYKTMYNLDNEQMFWRRIEIEDADGGIEQFRREYPATVEEAFDSTMDGGFMETADVVAAMKADIPQGKHKVLVGLDIGGDGKTADRTVFSFRAGRHHFKTLVFEKKKAAEIILLAKEIMRQYKVHRLFVDKGYNPAIAEFLQRDFNDKVIPVFFGASADEPTKFVNKRAEMFYRLKKWIEDRPVKIENDNELRVELLAIKKKIEYDATGKLQLIPKAKIKEEIGVSTDKADALALTFAYHVWDYEDFGEDELEDEVESRHITGCKVTGY